MGPTTAAAMCGKGSPRSITPSHLLVRITLWSAPILRPSDAYCTWGADATLTLLAYRFQTLNRCLMSSGRMPHARKSHGATNGVWVTSSYGITGARCIGVIDLTRTRAGSCIAPRLKTKHVRVHDQSAQSGSAGSVRLSGLVLRMLFLDCSV